MIVITQLFYIHPGEEASFASFEAEVIPILAEHGALLLLRTRPAPGAEGALIPPHELHLVQFPDEAALSRYLADPRRQALLPLRDRAIASVLSFRASG